ATAFLATRFVQRRWGSNGVLGAVLWAGVSGLAVAIFAVIATRVTAFSYEDDSLGASLSMHSAGADMFFGTWLLIGLPLLLGHIAGGEKPSWWPLVADLAAAPRLALIHALAFALPIGALMMVGGVLGILVEGEGSSVLPTILSLPLWGLSGLALLAGMGMLVVPAHLPLKGGVEEFGVDRSDEFLWFFDLPWYVWTPMVLLALLLPAAVALLWHRDRELDDGNILALVASWAALPLAYFAGSVVLLALVWTSMQAEMGMMGDVVARIGLAPWMPLIAFFIGLTVEVLARFGAPFVDRFVPGILVNWFRRSARTRRAESQAAPTPESRRPARTRVRSSFSCSSASDRSSWPRRCSRAASAVSATSSSSSCTSCAPWVTPLRGFWPVAPMCAATTSPASSVIFASRAQVAASGSRWRLPSSIQRLSAAIPWAVSSQSMPPVSCIGGPLVAVRVVPMSTLVAGAPQPAGAPHRRRREWSMTQDQRAPSAAERAYALLRTRILDGEVPP